MYQRYHVETSPTLEIAPFPNRTRVKVKKHGLATHLLKELIRYRGNRKVALSRPCVYGVFSGPVGGFAPRDYCCVGCLRCTIEYPEMVQVYPEPEHRLLGDSYFTPEQVDTICYEARTGRIPVKGAGYRGPFGGEGWDGMWTDMSEIVRPTRDGIHGREYISTAVDIGRKSTFLAFDNNKATSALPPLVDIPMPVIIDMMPASYRIPQLIPVFKAAAAKTELLMILDSHDWGLLGDDKEANLPHIVFYLDAGGPIPEKEVLQKTRLVEISDEGDIDRRIEELKDIKPGIVVAIRVELNSRGEERAIELAHKNNIEALHLVADINGNQVGVENPEIYQGHGAPYPHVPGKKRHQGRDYAHGGRRDSFGRAHGQADALWRGPGNHRPASPDRT